MRTCTDCNTAKPDDEFYLSSTTRRSRSQCKACLKQATTAARRRRRERDPEGHRHTEWRGNLAKFGITPEGYAQLLEEQGGTCAICHRPETALSNRRKPKRLAVDHCHTTGRVRGLLCASCNTALGQMEEDLERIKRSIQYLQRAAPSGV